MVWHCVFELQFGSDTNLGSAFCQSISFSVVVIEAHTILSKKMQLSDSFIWEVHGYYWLQERMDLRIQTMSQNLFSLSLFSSMDFI